MLDHGGVYLDTDMIPVRRIDSLIKNKVVIGFEYSKMISTGFVAAEKDHPIFRKLVSIYESFDNLPDNKIKFIVNNEL
ncbi:MAG: hypothetical protein DRP42_06065 [Tenericutes bacterium]|nr:MAG: hypothetical protein DRP42_06065 [Mycoplasmatota bacterium]